MTCNSHDEAPTEPQAPAPAGAGTLGRAVRDFGAVIADAGGRRALHQLGLTGPGAPTFVCALPDTTTHDMAPHSPPTVLVIDLAGDRLACLHLDTVRYGDGDRPVPTGATFGAVLDSVANREPGSRDDGWARVVALT